MNAYYWVKIFNVGFKEFITIHHGMKPATPLAGPFKTRSEAVEAKKKIMQSGKVTTTLKTRRGKKANTDPATRFKK